MKLFNQPSPVLRLTTIFRSYSTISLGICLSLSLSLNAQSVEKKAIAQRYPVCTVSVTNEPGIKLLVTTDTLLDESGAKQLLRERFIKLDSFVVNHGLNTGRRILFTRCELCALFLEAAIEVDEVPSKLPQDITSRYLDGGSFVLAHYEGAYDGIGIAYDAIANHVKTNKLLTSDTPFEVFNAKPYKPGNPNIITVDVYQRIQQP